MGILSAGGVMMYNLYQAYKVNEELHDPFRCEEYEELQKGSGSFLDMTRYYMGKAGRQWMYWQMDDPENWG